MPGKPTRTKPRLPTPSPQKKRPRLSVVNHGMQGCWQDQEAYLMSTNEIRVGMYGKNLHLRVAKRPLQLYQARILDKHLHDLCCLYPSTDLRFSISILHRFRPKSSYKEPSHAFQASRRPDLLGRKCRIGREMGGSRGQEGGGEAILRGVGGAPRRFRSNLSPKVFFGWGFVRPDLARLSCPTCAGVRS